MVCVIWAVVNPAPIRLNCKKPRSTKKKKCKNSHVQQIQPTPAPNLGGNKMTPYMVVFFWCKSHDASDKIRCLQNESGGVPPTFHSVAFTNITWSTSMSCPCMTEEFCIVFTSLKIVCWLSREKKPKINWVLYKPRLETVINQCTRNSAIYWPTTILLGTTQRIWPPIPDGKCLVICLGD